MYVWRFVCHVYKILRLLLTQVLTFRTKKTYIYPSLFESDQMRTYQLIKLLSIVCCWQLKIAYNFEDSLNHTMA